MMLRKCYEKNTQTFSELTWLDDTVETFNQEDGRRNCQQTSKEIDFSFEGYRDGLDCYQCFPNGSLQLNLYKECGVKVETVDQCEKDEGGFSFFDLP